MLTAIAPRPATAAGCGISGLGFTLPQLPGLPDWLKDWRVWAVIIALVLIASGMLGGKAMRSRRRKRLAMARLRYLEERLK